MVETPQTRSTDGGIHPGYWLKKKPIDPCHSREKNRWKVQYVQNLLGFNKDFLEVEVFSQSGDTWGCFFLSHGSMWVKLQELLVLCSSKFRGTKYGGHFSWWVMVLERPLHPKIYLWVSEWVRWLSSTVSVIVTFIPGGGDLLRDSPSGAQFKVRRKEHHPEDLDVSLRGNDKLIQSRTFTNLRNTNLRNPAMDSLAIFSGLCSYEWWAVRVLRSGWPIFPYENAPSKGWQQGGLVVRINQFWWPLRPQTTKTSGLGKHGNENPAEVEVDPLQIYDFFPKGQQIHHILNFFGGSFDFDSEWIWFDKFP